MHHSVDPQPNRIRKFVICLGMRVDREFVFGCFIDNLAGRVFGHARIRVPGGRPRFEDDLYPIQAKSMLLRHNRRGIILWPNHCNPYWVQSRGADIRREAHYGRNRVTTWRRNEIACGKKPRRDDGIASLEPLELCDLFIISAGTSEGEHRRYAIAHELL